MKHAHPRIVFMGTPEFAVPSLEALVQAGFPVVGVVTAPDKPAGRGQQLQASAVKQAALRLGIPVLQPEKL
ncbi:MAG TPA: methionyl-tRNA formyltransferase, partial [Bacteroidia bacterium]|nr:methionyl-tRNA formyltransferase [Bacteroidia bacterium]